MKTEEALTVQDNLPANNSGGFLQIIDRVVGSGEMTPEKVAVLERLLAMQMTVREEERKAAFANDLASLQSELPQIQKDGRIMVKGVLRSTYALTEDIDTAIRPLLSKYGFSFAFDSDSKDGKMFTLSSRLLHKMGHSETKSLLLPFDASEFRSQIQSVNSTITNGKRILRAMHLNLIERGRDDDGQGGDKKITEDQARDLQALMEEVKQDIPRFLKYFDIAKVSDLPAKELAGAIQDLERKRK